MTTLPIRAPQTFGWTVPGFARVVSALTLLLDAMIEARAMATEAHKRYPFAAW